MQEILVVDDEISICKTLALHLKSQGYAVQWVNTAGDGLDRLSEAAFDMVILDVHLPDMDGLTMLQKIGNRGIEVPVIVITAFHDLELTVKAMQYGAVEFIHKPIDIGELDDALTRAMDQRTEKDIIDLSDKDMAGTVVGCSRSMKEVFKIIGLVSQSRSTVLIEGESGTGKELIAHAIHANTSGAIGSFIPVNCAAIVETLLESELFGHEKGAFTGAVTRKDGKFSQARGGALFLDEIGDMSQQLQAKLLRVLQDHCYHRVGGNETQVFDGRVIAATNRDLQEMVEQGKFRQDLYYRLNVVKITVPPLRERVEDIPVLVNHLVNKINQRLKRNVTKIPISVMEEMTTREWPGNVRQMENALTRAIVMARGDTLELSQNDGLQEHDGEAGELSRNENGEVPTREPALMSIAEMERDLIDRTLKSTHWHKGRACEILGISRPRLERKVKLYQLHR